MVWGLSGQAPGVCRVSNAETMEIAEMVLGKVNKSLVSLMQKIGLKAVGISGKDGGMFTVKKKFPGGKDIGYVGEITKVDTSLLTSLIEDDFIPVIAPIGVDENYEDYNINADDAACAVATARIATMMPIATLRLCFERFFSCSAASALADC